MGTHIFGMPKYVALIIVVVLVSIVAGIAVPVVLPQEAPAIGSIMFVGAIFAVVGIARADTDERDPYKRIVPGRVAFWVVFMVCLVLLGIIWS